MDRTGEQATSATRPPGIIDEQEYDGEPCRVFFAKDSYGVCFCFTHPLDPVTDA